MEIKISEFLSVLGFSNGEDCTLLDGFEMESHRHPTKKNHFNVNVKLGKKWHMFNDVDGNVDHFIKWDEAQEYAEDRVKSFVKDIAMASQHLSQHMRMKALTLFFEDKD